MSNRNTLARYQTDAHRWTDRRTPDHPPVEAFGRELADLDTTAPAVDLGCGPGWYTEHLNPNAIAVDATRAMLDQVAARAPAAPRVQADVAALPFRSGSLRGALAANVYVHLRRSDVPAALADLHRSLTVDARVELRVFGDQPIEATTLDDDDFADRRFSSWDEDSLDDVLAGAGFEIVDRIRRWHEGATFSSLRRRLRRLRTLPDTVGPSLRVLICGLNPSLHAADAGVGFVSPSNRFWPAALAAGLVGVDRDPFDALRHHGVGMTDLVKRASPRARELTDNEYQRGLERLERLAAWLRPAAVCFVGLAGWRAAADRGAATGWQDRRLADVPVYLMPSTSGLNASSQHADFVAHLREVQQPAS